MPENQTEIDQYASALAAEPQLQAIESLVGVLVANAPKGRPYPYAPIYIWGIIKPLVNPWVGGGRGYLPRQAERKVFDPTTDLERLEATTEIERWMRSDEAYVVVTNHWVSLLHQLDTGPESDR